MEVSDFSLNPEILKGLCHGSPVHFVLNSANYLPSIAMELKVSKEITCK